MREARPGVPGSIQRRRARVSLSMLGVRCRSFRVAHRQAAMRLDMLPDQPSLGISDVRMQNFRLGVDAVRQVHRNEQASHVTIEHAMERDAPGMAFLPGGR